MIQIKRLTETAKIPTLGTERAAGYDLYADEDCTIPARSRCPVKTGIALSLRPDTAALIWPRSGLARKGIDAKAGLIDPDYRGPIIALLANETEEPFRIETGDRIAQLVVVPVYRSGFEEVDSLDSTTRGEGGFGSTGR